MLPTASLSNRVGAVWGCGWAIEQPHCCRTSSTAPNVHLRGNNVSVQYSEPRLLLGPGRRELGEERPNPTRW